MLLAVTTAFVTAAVCTGYPPVQEGAQEGRQGILRVCQHGGLCQVLSSSQLELLLLLLCALRLCERQSVSYCSSSAHCMHVCAMGHTHYTTNETAAPLRAHLLLL
jgi:hypothetical protein